MAVTVTIDALRREVWAKSLLKDEKDMLYFTNRNMMGSDSNNIIQVKDDLKKQMGDTYTFGLSVKLSGAGILGDSTLEGNEEAITTYSQSVSINQWRTAVKMTGRLDMQKASYDMLDDAKEKLAIARVEFLERQFFLKLGGITTTTLTDVNSVTYSGNATWSNSPNVVPTAHEAAGTGARYLCAEITGLDAMANADIFTTDLITQARIKAAMASPKIMPIRVDGQDYYVLFIHPWQAGDLKTNTNSKWAQAQREAGERGKNNNIFTGALGVWDGVIIHEHEYVGTAQATAAFAVGGTAVPAGVRAFRATLCGRQSLCYAECNNPNTFVVKEEFDYFNAPGVASGIIGGVQKTAFNSVDYGVISIDTGASTF